MSAPRPVLTEGRFEIESVGDAPDPADLMGARDARDPDLALHVWDNGAAGRHEVRGQRLGIVGGSPPSVVAQRLGLRVLCYDSQDRPALGQAMRCGSLDELLEPSETITGHIDGQDGSAGLFGAAQFRRIPARTLFPNLARGFVVDHRALAGPPSM